MTSPVILAAKAKHTATLIFLHGLGDTGQGWASAMAAIRPAYVKVICPTAETMPVTLNAGFRMPSWFDLRALDASGPEDEEGIKDAAKSINDLVISEIQMGIPANRIILGGFSQGGALAIYTALTMPHKLAGVVTLSGWLPLHKSFPSTMKTTADLAVLQCHGDCDPVVPYKWGQMTASYLKTFLTASEFRTYRGLAHSSSDEELKDMKSFLEKYLPNV